MSTDDTENELLYRSAAHNLRRSIRTGNIVPDMEKLAKITAELFDLMAEEAKACGDSDGPSTEMLVEFLRELTGGAGGGGK